MKNIFKITFGLIACVAMFTACSDDEELMEFQLDKTEITVGAEGALETINVTAAQEWIAVSNEPWITLSPANGMGSALCNIAPLPSRLRDRRLRLLQSTRQVLVILSHSIKKMLR